MSSINVRLGKEEEEMITTLLRVIPKFKMKKELVLVEGLRQYYRNQEKTKFKR